MADRHLDDRYRAMADALAVARATATPIAPLTETAGLTTSEAYLVQGLVVADRVRDGATAVGWKVGLTSAAVQRQFGVSEPDLAPLLDEDDRTASGVVALETLIAPRAEGEIALRLGVDLEGPGVDEVAVLAATDAVMPAIEIVDSRIRDWRITLADTVADSASASRFVLGPPAAVGSLDELAAATLTLSVDGTTVASGQGSAALGNPARAVAWLTNALAARGECLRAGDVVLAGALHAALPVTTACRIVARVEPFGLAEVGFR